MSVRRRIEELTQDLTALKARLGPNFCTTTNHRKSGTNRQQDLWKTIYHLDGKPYLGPPQWQHTDDGMRLVFSKPIRNLDAFVDRNSDVLFVVYQNFRLHDSEYLDESMDLKDLSRPKPVNESMVIVSARMAYI